MDQALLQEQAERIANRVGSAVSMGSAAVLTILLSVLPQLVSCWTKEDEADPNKANAAIRAQNEKAPKRLLRRTSVAIRRKAPAGQKPSLADAQVLARETIADACEAAPDRVAAFFSRCCAS
jgi:hypothetical protein